MPLNIPGSAASYIGVAALLPPLLLRREGSSRCIYALNILQEVCVVVRAAARY